MPQSVASHDQKTGVRMGKILNGYFSSDENVKHFINSSLSGTQIPQEVIDQERPLHIEDWGGGEGDMLLGLINYFKQQGINVDSCLFDVNEIALEKAKQKGLTTKKTPLEKIEDQDKSDIIICRSVWHYSPIEIQEQIAINIHRSLRLGGVFIHQIGLPGSGSQAAVDMRNEIWNSPNLKRVNASQGQRVQWITLDRYISILEKAGFNTEDIEYCGNAPDIFWTLEYIWNRVNGTRSQENANSEAFFSESLATFRKYLEAYDFSDLGFQALFQIEKYIEAKVRGQFQIIKSPKTA